MSKTFDIDDRRLPPRQAEFVRAAVELFDAALDRLADGGAGVAGELQPLLEERVAALQPEQSEEGAQTMMLHAALMAATAVGLGSASVEQAREALAQQLGSAFPGLEITLVDAPASERPAVVIPFRTPAQQRAILMASWQAERAAWPGRSYELETSVAAGSRARVLAIQAECEVGGVAELPKHIPRTVDTMIEWWLGAVRAGCFTSGAAAAPVQLLERRLQQRGDVEAGVWQVALPATTPAAIASLIRLCDTAERYGVPMVRLSVFEQGSPDLHRLPIEKCGSAGVPAAPFEVLGEPHVAGKEVALVATFEREDDEGAVLASEELFTAWCTLLSAGGFTGSSSVPHSSGFLDEVTEVMADEVVANIRFADCGPDGVAALVAGFVAIHHTISPLRSLDLGQ